MRKKYLINNSKPGEFILKNQFHKALAAQGFIEEITPLPNSAIVVAEAKTQQNLTITHLNTNSVSAIWRINLEMEITGISSKNTAKTPEVAILVLQNLGSTYCLNVFLIELKQTLKNSEMVNGKRKAGTLEICKEKLVGGMNRVYMLLSLLNHQNPQQRFDHATILVKFQGLIFYEKNQIANPPNNQPTPPNNDLYQLLQNPNTGNGLINVESFLSPNDKIWGRFFNQTPTLKLQHLLAG